MPTSDFKSLLEKSLNGENEALALWLTYSKEHQFDEQETQHVLTAIDEILLDPDSPKRKNALFLKGYWHYLGIGIKQDYSKTIELYDEAINLGHDFAMNHRAFMHQYGQGDKVNYLKAIELYERAIALGHNDAMNSRAFMHQYGQGDKVNYPKAIELYERATALGSTKAMFNRAWMHYNGKGGDVDYPKARALFEQASNLGYSPVMETLANMYMKGLGGDRTYTQAFTLLKRHAQATGKVSPLIFFVYEVKNDAGVANLYTQIHKMAQYATINPDKEKTVRELAQALEEKLNSFLADCYKTITENKKVTPEKEAAFKSEFNQLLHSKDSEMAVHSQAWKPIIANILIALSGIGLVALIINIAAQAISSHNKNTEFSKNKAFFFAQTQAEQLTEETGQSVEKTDLKLKRSI
jgi:TPR repeat protein